MIVSKITQSIVFGVFVGAPSAAALQMLEPSLESTVVVQVGAICGLGAMFIMLCRAALVNAVSALKVEIDDKRSEEDNETER
jgi:hypothetical protein